MLSHCSNYRPLEIKLTQILLPFVAMLIYSRIDARNLRAGRGTGGCQEKLSSEVPGGPISSLENQVRWKL